jgi:choice-of-anchor B domain-containing protein
VTRTPRLRFHRLRHQHLRHHRLAALRLALAALAVGALQPAPPAGACGETKHAVRGIFGHAAEDIPPPSQDSEPLSDVPCQDGWADVYACDGVDLLAVLPRRFMGTDPAIATANDLWGWVDPQTGIEYALVGLADGTAFVSLEDPRHPRFLGKLPTRTVTVPWRDIKTYRDHAFIVADGADHGMQVFDLTQLRNVGASPATFQPTAEYIGPGLAANAGFSLGNAHNLAINEETGFAYAVGSSTCGSGLHMIDLREPRRPRFAGCFAETGYTHDTQCVIYRGPDAEHRDREVCFNSDPSPSSLSVVDVTDKSAPRLISRAVYPNGVYSHQGWLSPDQRFFFLGDELDEVGFGHPTRTLVWDVADLDAPRLLGQSDATTLSIGHNMYSRGGLLYQANYTSGVRVLSMARASQARLDEVAFFDVFPATDGPVFRGAWTVYPDLPSGILIANSIDGGLFVLQPHDLPGRNGPVRPLGPRGPRPERPTRLRLQVDGFDLRLSWSDRSDDEEGFRIYRSVDRGPALLYAEVAADTTELTDVIEPGRVYEYRVRAFHAGGESEASRVSVESFPPELERPRAEHPRAGGHVH